MSADNGIYILQSKDGYRVVHLQAIENIYYFPLKCCGKQKINEDTNVCTNCGEVINWEETKEINPKILREFFGNRKVFKNKEAALKEANRIYEKIMNDPCPICEYGISYVRGWEKKNFPK